MHPLEVQVNDLKAQLEAKELKLRKAFKGLLETKTELAEIREMLHPSRQKRVDVLSQKIENAMTG